MKMFWKFLKLVFGNSCLVMLLAQSHFRYSPNCLSFACVFVHHFALIRLSLGGLLFLSKQKNYFEFSGFFWCITITGEGWDWWLSHTPICAWPVPWFGREGVDSASRLFLTFIFLFFLLFPMVVGENSLFLSSQCCSLDSLLIFWLPQLIYYQYRGTLNLFPIQRMIMMCRSLVILLCSIVEEGWRSMDPLYYYLPWLKKDG